MNKLLFISIVILLEILFSFYAFGLPLDVYYLTTIAAQNPTEGSTTTVTFNCSINDEFPLLVVNATLSKTTETNRTDDSCSEVETINLTAKIYECSMNMQFYDGAGTWNYECYAEDIFSASDMMSSTFTYNSLEAWTMSPSSISFGTVYLGQTDASATDDPIVLTNTGNSALTGQIKIKAFDLTGTTNLSQYIPAGNFSANVNNACNGDSLINDTFVTISSTSLPKGASSTEDMYVYLEEVPSSGLSYQTYNTAGLGQWIITTE